MTNEEFELYLKDELDEIRFILTKKGEEYGEQLNRFSNFEQIGRHTRKSPEENAFTLMMKQFVYVENLCLGYLDSTKVSKPMINEKFGDCINYLILLKGMFLEKLGEHI